MIFIIEKECFDQTDIRSFCEAIERAGHTYLFINIKNAHEVISAEYNTEVFYYGGLNRAKWLLAYGIKSKWFPGIIGNFPHYFCSYYMSMWPKELFVNHDYKITSASSINSIFPLFIRPDSPFKPFTGQVYENKELFKEDARARIMIASPKKIADEYRIVISSGKVITGTSYILDGDINTELGHEEIPYFVRQFSEEVAKLSWQPDKSYVLDVGVLDSGDAKIVEINALSTSGLYNIDYDRLVEVVSKGENKYEQTIR